MKIILNKNDIKKIIKKVFNIEAVCWNDDGTLTIDTVLEKITNNSNFNETQLKKYIKKIKTK